MTTTWKTAQATDRRLKACFWGPFGCLKTRTALAFGGQHDPPTLAVLDTEHGTDHYAEEFNFLRVQITDFDAAVDAVSMLAIEPGAIRTLVVDSFSVLYVSCLIKWEAIFRKREPRGKGNYSDYYKFQPADYPVMHRDFEAFIRILLDTRMNVIVTCQEKPEYAEGEMMKRIGVQPDAYKRLPYYFDTVIQVTGKPGAWQGQTAKDRTGRFSAEPFSFGIEAIGTAAGDWIDRPIEYVPTPATLPPALTPEQAAVADEIQDGLGLNADAADDTANNGAATDEQLGLMVRYKRAGISDTKWREYLDPFSVTSAKQLTQVQARDLLATLGQDRAPF
jgi:AAA domain-containing protein